jgi:hypothetical protein
VSRALQVPRREAEPIVLRTLDSIPFVLVGNGLDFKMGRSLKFKNLPHNRLLLSLAQGMSHDLKRFGNPDFCGDGGLPGLT